MLSIEYDKVVAPGRNFWILGGQGLSVCSVGVVII